MNILTLNTGSNSLKFEIVAIPSSGERPGFGSSLVSGAFDDVGKPNSSFKLFDHKRERQKTAVSFRDLGEATSWLLNWVDEGNARGQGIRDLSDIAKIGHRIVHGGDEFTHPSQITEELITRIETWGELAPLHTGPAIQVIRAAQATVADRIPMVAVFDTAFHCRLPDEAALYALPIDVARRHKIRRYGFHGISHRYLMLRYAEITRRPFAESKLITLHLEGGSSAAAIRGGHSIDTSMGFTPLEGLVMGTRSGDLDAGILIHLMRNEGWSADELEIFLNKRCGLLGVSTVSADTRQLVEHLAEPPADLAIDLFCYRVRKYIGAYLAVLGGADAIVFGGGIGENTPWCASAFVARWHGAERPSMFSAMSMPWIRRLKFRPTIPRSRYGSFRRRKG